MPASVLLFSAENGERARAPLEPACCPARRHDGCWVDLSKPARATQASKQRRRYSPSLPVLAAWWTPAWKVGHRGGSGRKSAGFSPQPAATCVGHSRTLLTPNVAVRLAAERRTVNKLPSCGAQLPVLLPSRSRRAKSGQFGCLLAAFGWTATTRWRKGAKKKEKKRKKYYTLAPPSAWIQYSKRSAVSTY